MLAQHFLPYAKQRVANEDIQEVALALKGDWITRGPLVEQFERRVAEYCEVQYAVAFNSGSSALAACYHAADVQPSDRVYSTPNSFIASVGPAAKVGARVVFCDVEPQTGNLDISQLDLLLKQYHSRGRPFVVPVHFGGLSIDMRAVERCLRDPDGVLIEDACHALGGRYPDGKKVGNCEYSHMTVFSFHPAKVVTTGEGGMVTTNDPELYRRLQKFRNNGIERDSQFLQNPSPGPWYYEVQELTGNYHMTDFQAALGLSQFERIDDFIQERRQVVTWYRERLRHVPELSLTPDEGDERSAHHLFVCRIDFEQSQRGRAELMQFLTEQAIGTQVHYVPLYRQPVLQSSQTFENDSFSGMESYYNSALSLPLYVGLEKEDVDRVCEKLLQGIRSNP